MTAQHGNNNPWSEAREEKLRRGWTAGHSAREIAATLGGSLTAAAVIGKAHRLGLAARAAPVSIARAAAEKRSPPALTVKSDKYAGNGVNARGGRASIKTLNDGRVFAPSVVKAFAHKIEPANDDAIPLNGRSRFQCAWPVGTPDRPANQLCCGQPVPEGANATVESYCGRHATQASAGKVDAKAFARSNRRAA